MYHDAGRTQHEGHEGGEQWRIPRNTITVVVRVTFGVAVPWKPQVAGLGVFESASFVLVLARIVEGIALLDAVRLFTGSFGGVVSMTRRVSNA